jgi:hypothetical protein
MLPRMLPNNNFTKCSCTKKIHNSLIWLAVPRGVEPPTFGLGNLCFNQKRIRGIFASPQRDLALSPGTPSAHGNWRARDDSNTRTLPQEPPPTSKPSKIRPVAAGRGFVY